MKAGKSIKYFKWMWVSIFFIPTFVFSQVSKNQTLMLNIQTNASGYEIIWPLNNTRTGNYYVYQRDLTQLGSSFQLFGSAIKGPAQKTSVNTNLKNVEFLVQYVNPNNQLEALGYISASNEFIPEFSKGRVIILIDSALFEGLKLQIDTLQMDLLSNGWFYSLFKVDQKKSPELIKDSILKIVKQGNFRQNALYIIGHVPVPYSGYFSSTGTRPPPDGHVEGSGNHTGAWPADVFYGDFEGIWEDMLVNCTTGSDTRNHNISGDGKFDPSAIPGKVSLDIGRLDFSNLPAFSSSELELTKSYLSRVHRWKNGGIPYIKRGLIDDNFTGLNLASTGYHNLSCFIGFDSIFDNRDYFQSQKQGNYWWSYGCGAGSYTSCNGIGSSSDFANLKTKDSFHNIFTILAGSYFGDWDSRNNLLRSSLAAGSLATFWGGIPKWYIHHMANGKHIGYGAKITQNNTNEYFNGSFNGSHNSVHIALLGDPTLELMPIKPPSNLTATSTNGTVQLSWNASPDANEYEVYIIDLDSQKIIPVSSTGTCQTVITDTNFQDNCNWRTGNYTYGVLATAISVNASGSFKNRSLLSLTNVQHLNQKQDKTKTLKAKFYPNPSQNKVYTHEKIMGKCTWTLMDLNGRKIAEKSTSDAQNGIDLSGYISGSYILKISNDQGFQFQEIICLID